MPLRAALYLRISKDDKQTGLAVERQRDECLRAIEREKLELVETYTDNGVSAYARNVKRPAFDLMTSDYERGKFDVVVCWDIDRFSRQPIQLERWIELGDTRGLKIITPSEVTDLGSDNGRLFFRLKGSIARAEVERKSARQRAQALQAKANGTFKARIGYNESEVIVRIFREVLAGAGVYAVARSLNEDGLRTLRGHAWSGQAVRGIVKTPRHRGALVSEKDYDDAVSLVSQGVRVGPKKRGLFSGVARCSTCSAAMTASGPKYVCSFSTNHPGSKGHRAILRSVLEPKIDAAMVAAFAFGRETMDPQSEDLTAVDVELARVAEARRRLVRLLTQDLVTEAEATADLRDLGHQLARLEERRSELVAASARTQMLDGLVASIIRPGRVAISDVVELKKALYERWTALEDDKRRELAREFLTVTIHADKGPEKRVQITHRVATMLNEEEEAA